MWPSNADGTLRFDVPTAAFAKRGISNTTIQNAPQLFSYFSFSGTRVTRFDEYEVELSGGATVVAENAPVVLTQSVNIAGEPTVEMSGRVLSEGSSPVIERGFVYAASDGVALSSVSLASAPTVNDAKIVLGDGAGDFSGSTELASSGTYVFRAYATNSSGTSYGSEQTIVYVASQPPPASDSDSSPDPDSSADPDSSPDPAPTPASEPAVNVPQLPTVSDSQPTFGAPTAVIGGQPVSTVITPSPSTNPSTTGGSSPLLGFTVETTSAFGEPISLFLSPFGNMDPFSNPFTGVVGNSLVIGPSGAIEMDLAGFQPFSPVDVWMFSTPTRLAQVITDANGAYPGLIVPLSDIAPGRHTLYIRGTLASGEPAELTARVWVAPNELAFTDVGILSVHGPAITHLATVNAARGHTSGQFKQSSALTRGQAATILTNLFDLEPAPNPFVDADSSIHAAGIGSLAALGVISGFDDGSYRPDQILTRAQAAMILQRLLALEESTSTFTDVTGSFSAGAIGALESLGLVSGVTTDSFAPELPVQRGQFATMAVNALYHRAQAS